jgi:hypothetical protein
VAFEIPNFAIAGNTEAKFNVGDHVWVGIWYAGYRPPAGILRGVVHKAAGTQYQILIDQDCRTECKCILNRIDKGLGNYIESHCEWLLDRVQPEQLRICEPKKSTPWARQKAVK